MNREIEEVIMVDMKEEPKKLKGRKNWMRNKPCKCGSGKKLKKCCWGKMASLKVEV